MTDLFMAKMFLAEERGIVEGESFRSYQTFNFGHFFNEHKIAFGNLYVLNDDTLAGGCSTTITVTESSYIILLPVVGAIAYKDSLGNENLINAGEIQIIALPVATDCDITNPYESDLVNYIRFQVKIKTPVNLSVPLLMGFDLELNKNNLIDPVNISHVSEHPLSVSIGQFRGREETLYTLKNDKAGLFAFVIEGAFEVEGRLLHPRDGLALRDLSGPVEMEALSNEAVILLMEIFF